MVLVEGTRAAVEVGGGVSSGVRGRVCCDDSGCAIGSLSLLGEGEDVCCSRPSAGGADADGGECSEAGCSRSDSRGSGAEGIMEC